MKRSWPLAYAAFLFGLIGLLNFMTPGDHQYRRLAEAFLAGKLSLLPDPMSNWADTAPFGGHYYSAFSPLPAVLWMPFVWAGYYQPGQLSFVASLVVFYLCFRLARRLDYSPDQACWFALAFCFATSFVGVAALPCSTFFAHVLAVLLLFLALNLYEGNGRLWMVGGLIGLAMASRAPAGLNILFFCLAIVFGAGPTREKVTALAKLLLPFSAVAGLLALYNFARFGNPFELGYSYQLNGFGTPYATWDVPGNTPGPPLSLRHIPKHLWIFLFGLPSTDAVGTSVLLVSPFLVYVGLVPKWDLVNKLIAVNCVVVLSAVLAFRSTGFEQMGYRFSLDFLPFVFWLLMRSRIELTGRFKSLILIATIVDACLTAFFLASGVDRRQSLN